MFDTMTLTKTVGGVCGTLLIFLLGNWAADSIYAMDATGHDGETVQAYVIPTEEGEEAPAEEEAEVSFEELLASADASAGEKVFNKCRACHKLDGSNGTGPHLDGVVMRAVASVDGFAYSDGMVSHGGDWTPDALNEFLADPKGIVPGTKMSFAGLNKIEDRADVVAYLQSLGG
ncbi:c-type cytochrome [Celeribacter indicus]|uniref:Cytochrome c, class I n=1 Tax=Celeribacter indicus TaxID=1208324 RepID=A0A0B5E681_9RHOB|nr:cytochrome c family protein [Celeribacter indicus]AJE48920.1 cytochrome c, class I [Celeribacter indicus]SDW41189.1 cytochrome c [Celeribacter indicus]